MHLQTTMATIGTSKVDMPSWHAVAAFCTDRIDISFVSAKLYVFLDLTNCLRNVSTGYRNVVPRKLVWWAIRVVVSPSLNWKVNLAESLGSEICGGKMVLKTFLRKFHSFGEVNIAGFQPPQVDPEDTFRENAKGPMLIICGTEDEVCTRPPLSINYATWMKFHHCRCFFTNVVITFSNISYHIFKFENTLWR